MEGKAIIFSAPSGSGKTTIVQHLLEARSQLQFSISATTRLPRGKEVDGKDYFFMSLEEYQGQKFVESEEVYEGVFYGTLESEVRRIWQNNQVVVFDVDVQGGINLKKYFGENALSIFVKVPNLEVLRERLTLRKTESEQDLQKRISKAESELSYADQFDHILINDQLEQTLLKAEELIDQFLGS